MKAKVKLKREEKIKAIQAELDKLNKKFKKSNSVRVGLPANSNPYPDGTSVVAVGAIHEFGADDVGIPQRSFLRTTLKEKAPEMKSFFRKITKKVVKGEMDKVDGLSLAGVKMVGFIISKISAGIPPQLKTREGTPLRDTGHLIQSITHEVPKK